MTINNLNFAPQWPKGWIAMVAEGDMLGAAMGGCDQTNPIWIISNGSNLGLGLFGWGGGFLWCDDGRGGWIMVTGRGDRFMVEKSGGFDQVNPIWVGSNGS